ncbi:MAG: molybdenum cofactor guanylyltransferase [Hyphomicrobium sp.]|nr:molybdenum cofactor guanylyltransferase [Hyphomicrobium sp.]
MASDLFGGAHILGVILAGGAARRMGGGDKGLRPFAGDTLLGHVIQRFGPQVHRLILNANGDPARLERFGLPIVADLDGKSLGPLAGLLAAMDYAGRTPPPPIGAFTHIAAVSTDVPYLPLDLIERLAAAAGSGAAIAVSDGRRHPTIGLWPLSLKASLMHAIAHGELSANAFAAHHGAVEVTFPFSETDGMLVDPFLNVNTPQDLEIARRLAARPL